MKKIDRKRWKYARMLKPYLSALLLLFMLLLLFVSDASTWSVEVSHLLSLSFTFTTASSSSPPWLDDGLTFAFAVDDAASDAIVALVSMIETVFSTLIQCSEQLSTQLQSFCILFKSEIKSENNDRESEQGEEIKIFRRESKRDREIVNVGIRRWSKMNEKKK